MEYIRNKDRLEIYTNAYLEYERYVKVIKHTHNKLAHAMCYFLQIETSKITPCNYDHLYNLLLEFGEAIDNNIDYITETSYLFDINDYKSRIRLFKKMIKTVKQLIKSEQ